MASVTIESQSQGITVYEVTETEARIVLAGDIGLLISLMTTKRIRVLNSKALETP
jgi:hypothetical protein